MQSYYKQSAHDCDIQIILYRNVQSSMKILKFDSTEYRFEPKPKILLQNQMETIKIVS